MRPSHKCVPYGTCNWFTLHLGDSSNVAVSRAHREAEAAPTGSLLSSRPLREEKQDVSPQIRNGRKGNQGTRQPANLEMIRDLCPQGTSLPRTTRCDETAMLAAVRVLRRVREPIDEILSSAVITRISDPLVRGFESSQSDGQDDRSDSKRQGCTHSRFR